jgi:preprotein translocase subunit YajC
MSQSAMSILLIVLMIGLLYFMMIRPQQKRMRQQMELMNSLKVGDDVMTSSGIYGSVSEVEEDTVILEVAEDVHVRMAKNAIVRVFTEHEETEEEEEEPEEAAGETGEPQEEPEERKKEAEGSEEQLDSDNGSRKKKAKGER